MSSQVRLSSVTRNTAGEGSERELHLVTFQIGAEEFALNITQVQEIIRVPALTRVPNAPSFVPGVINLRGKIIPMLSLRRRMGLEEQPTGKQTRIIIVETGGAVLGLRVDRVCEVMRLSAASIEPTPQLGKREHEYVAGLVRAGEHLVVLLDVNQLLGGEESAMSAQPVELQDAEGR